MKRIATFALTATIAALPFAGNAQNVVSNHDAAAKELKMVRRLFAPAGEKTANRAVNPARWQPQTEKYYLYYSDSGFEYLSTHNKTYNKHGLVVTDKEWTDENSEMRLSKYEYDIMNTSVVTKRTEETYDTPSAAEPSHIYVSKRVDVTRNEKFWETLVENYGPNSSYTGLELESKIEFGYPATGGKCNKIAVTTYDDGVAQTITLSNIVWKTNNGMLLNLFCGDDTDNLLSDYRNLIKSADVQLSADGVSASGTLTTNYSDGDKKREMTLEVAAGGEPILKQCSCYEVKDNYGSFVSTNLVESAGEEPEYDCTVMTYNDKQELLEESYYTGTSESDRQLSNSSKYEYSYNGETGRADNVLVTQYDQNTGDYVLTYKVEFSDYFDIFTSVKSAAAESLGGKTAVYNAQGMYVGSSAENLVPGLYIVKQGGKSFKLAK